jgi:DNA-directed RNA polymerase specialized sigma24 family protein
VNDLRQSTVTAQSGNSQAIESATPRAGRSRVKPRHLSPLLKRLIVEQFAARQSSEDVAEDMRLPVRTVDDVIKLAILRGRAA